MDNTQFKQGELWRVSVATYNRVLFPHPQNDTWMLALERRATAMRDGREDVHIWSQPFGGAVRILDPSPLATLTGGLQFDSERSKREQDFRILIPPSLWEQVKNYCLHHLANPGDTEIESSPERELKEEFAGAIQVDLRTDQYTARPLGFVIENNPLQTDNIYAHGQLTVRVYRIFDVRITDPALCETMLVSSQRYSNQQLETLALKDARSGGRGRVNSILALPLNRLTDFWLTIPPEARFKKIEMENDEFDESVLSVLWEIEVPQYQRMSIKP